MKSSKKEKSLNGVVCHSSSLGVRAGITADTVGSWSAPILRHKFELLNPKSFPGFKLKFKSHNKVIENLSRNVPSLTH